MELQERIARLEAKLAGEQAACAASSLLTGFWPAIHLGNNRLTCGAPEHAELRPRTLSQSTCAGVEAALETRLQGLQEQVSVPAHTSIACAELQRRHLWALHAQECTGRPYSLCTAWLLGCCSALSVCRAWCAHACFEQVLGRAAEVALQAAQAACMSPSRTSAHSSGSTVVCLPGLDTSLWPSARCVSGVAEHPPWPSQAFCLLSCVPPCKTCSALPVQVLCASRACWRLAFARAASHARLASALSIAVRLMAYAQQPLASQLMPVQGHARQAGAGVRQLPQRVQAAGLMQLVQPGHAAPWLLS